MKILKSKNKITKDDLLGMDSSDSEETVVDKKCKNLHRDTGKPTNQKQHSAKKMHIKTQSSLDDDEDEEESDQPKRKWQVVKKQQKTPLLPPDENQF